MKRLAGAKHDSYGAVAFVALSIVAALCGDHFAGVWHARPPRSSRTPQVRCMVLRYVCAGSGGAGVADVSRFALKMLEFSWSQISASTTSSTVRQTLKP